MLGLFSIWLLAPLAAIVGFGLHRMWPTSGSASPAGSAVWAAALLVAVLSTATNMAQPSEQLIGGRDGGTYMLTAAWLAQDGALLIDARQGPFGESPDLDFGGPGFFRFPRRRPAQPPISPWAARSHGCRRRGRRRLATYASQRSIGWSGADARFCVCPTTGEALAGLSRAGDAGSQSCICVLRPRSIRRDSRNDLRVRRPLGLVVGVGGGVSSRA